MQISEAAYCKHCTEPGTLQHELMNCDFNVGVGQLLLTCLQEHLPNSTAAQLLQLELVNLPEDMKLPFTILIATTLKQLWLQRTSLSRVHTYQVRAELEQTINLLRTSRLRTVAPNLALRTLPDSVSKFMVIRHCRFMSILKTLPLTLIFGGPRKSSGP